MHRADAAIIGVNFSAGGFAMAAADQPGIVSGANWNNVTGSSGTNVALQDSLAASTTAVLTYSSAIAYGSYATPAISNAATNKMYRSGLGGDSILGEVHITLTAIPYAAYAVYVYASEDTTDTHTLSITDGSTTFYYRGNGSRNSSAASLLETTGTNSLSPTIGPAQYQIFHETSSSVTFKTGGSINGVLGNNVFGIEIVDTAPEPGSLLTLAGGLGLLALLRTRALSR